MLKKSISLFLIPVFAFSCTVQKRKYQPGFDVQWKHHIKERTTEADTDKFNKYEFSDVAEKKQLLHANEKDSSKIVRNELVLEKLSPEVKIIATGNKKESSITP